MLKGLGEDGLDQLKDYVDIMLDGTPDEMQKLGKDVSDFQLLLLTVAADLQDFINNDVSQYDKGLITGIIYY